MRFAPGASGGIAARVRKSTIVLAVAAPLMAAHAGTALADPPANDTRAGAVEITSLPFTFEQDTQEATAGGPRFCTNNGSVFFEYTATEDGRLQADTFGSDYDTVLSVFTVADGRVEQVACNDDLFNLQSGVRFRAQAGVTYFFLIGFCCGNGQSGFGGNLVFSLSRPVNVALDASYTVSQTGTADAATGIATIGGTVTCNERAGVTIEGTLRQLRQGIFVARGFFFVNVLCTRDGPIDWTAEVDTETGVAFGSGSARANVNAFASDGFRDFLSLESVETTIALA
jgi:hypothetical protein